MNNEQIAEKNIAERKPKESTKRRWVILITILLSTLYIFVGNKIAVQGMTLFDGKNYTAVQKAKIVEIVDHIKEEHPLSETETLVVEEIIFNAEAISGEKKGEILKGEQNLNTYAVAQLKPVKVGDKVLLYNIPNEDYGTEWTLGEYVRTDALLLLGAIFMILLILFGRQQGFQTIISLIYTGLAIFVVFIPAILSGKNIYYWSILTCVFIILMTFLVVSGLNKKSLAAGIGCFGGVLVSGGLTIIMDRILKLTGMVDEDSVFLLLLNKEHPIDLKAIVFAAIIIGALGAVMDVAMSIASSLYEVKTQSKNVTFKMLIASGITIGRDIMGTMANTLVLAYIGGSLGVVLLLISYNTSLLDVLNRELVVVEILQALVGSIGILFTIPLTAIASGFFFKHVD
ncbi:YibE/F family protein [Fusibacter ferrireducens]|uniref:YibE/F family protein n=1 Tax=Fusibacter ferrireducens TaxID=2785058 RepID=A0ABR9ZQI6_9FIRM|nr:YibE/F family protein [Fusibacter ferrireducens]MBF4692711.1 YibE/F family protein [Fusibacter ferrireducens]